MFQVSFLPARFGDAIWIEYGDPEAPRRVLVDGGTRGTRREIATRLGASAAGPGGLELIVVTHVDRDHIEGVLGVLEEADAGLDVEDVWFNGWPQLPGNALDEHFGAVQGERLTARIRRLGLPWNEAFGGRAVAVPAHGPLPRRTLPGGLELTLLSPTREALDALKPQWEREVRAANLDPGFGMDPNDEEVDEEDEAFSGEELPDVAALSESPFVDDSSRANASSVALLAEFEGRRVLLAADAHAGALEASLERLSPGAPLEVDLMKISHHGSRNTTSRSLVEKLRCPRFVFSTSGAVYKHPHREAVARVIAGASGGCELIFNYRSAVNEVWDVSALKRAHGYEASYPPVGREGITVALA